jgi:uncharacterized membrane protein
MSLALVALVSLAVFLVAGVVGAGVEWLEHRRRTLLPRRRRAGDDAGATAVEPPLG